MMTPYSLQRAALVRSVSRDQVEFQRALDELKSVARLEWDTTREKIVAARERVDVKHQIAQKPLGFMAGAFVVGLWVGWSF